MTVGIMELPHEGLRLRGVTLAGDPNRGVRTVTGLELKFSTPGITILASPSTPERTLEWSSLDRASCSDTLHLADGSTTTVMVLVSIGRSVEFLLPGDAVTQDQVDFLRAALPIWLARYKGTVAATAPVSGSAVAALGGATLPSGVAQPASVAGAEPPPSSDLAAPPVADGPAGALGQSSSPLDAGRAGSRLPTLGQTYLPPPPPPMSSGVASMPTTDGAVAHPAAPARVGPPVYGSPLDGWGVPPVAAPDGTARSLGAWDPTGPEADAHSRSRNQHHTRTVVLLIVLLAVVVAGALYLIRRHHTDSGPASPTVQAVDAAVATSVNLRLADLPAGWSEDNSAPAGLPESTPAVRASALKSLASCVGRPLADVQGWFGVAFPDQVVRVSSPTFVAAPEATVRMSSATSVLESSNSSVALAAPFASPEFGTCLGQYQVAAAATTSVTAQVQAVPLTAPAGVQAYGYVTTYTTTGQSTETVGTAFIVGGRIATVLEPIAVGTSIPADDFTQAYNAVVARIARATP